VKPQSRCARQSGSGSPSSAVLTTQLRSPGCAASTLARSSGSSALWSEDSATHLREERRVGRGEEGW
jgi:hypothetical protein